MDSLRFVSSRPARGLALAAVLGLGLASPAAAEQMTAARKFGRGLAGLTLGILELPGNVVQESRTNGLASGATIGFAMGLGKIVVRTLTGVWDVVTAPFPLPSDFEPLLQPEFPWGYFDSAPGRVSLGVVVDPGVLRALGDSPEAQYGACMRA